MRMLAIECATEACSVALFENGELIASDHQVLGRGHAERLVPMISALPDRGRADRIAVSIGPGSFTGVRIGIATARALALAWKADAAAYPTLALVAAGARQQHGDMPVSVCMTAGHGQWFVQNFNSSGLPSGDAASVPPADAARICVHELAAGTQANALVELRGFGSAETAHPDARNVVHLPEALFLHTFTPAYGRAPDAKLPK